MKKAKVLLGAMVLCLGLAFCVSAFDSTVKADGPEPRWCTSPVCWEI